MHIMLPPASIHDKPHPGAIARRFRENFLLGAIVFDR